MVRNMDKLRCMEAYVAVIDGGNFSVAAASMGISPEMVGKHIRQLEALLGTRLLERTTRRQNVTDAGSAFYESARSILDEVKNAERAIENMQAFPQGLLRVSAPTTLGSCLIAPLLPGYLRQHSSVKVDLILNNRRVDLIAEDFDLAVRIGDMADADLVARSFGLYRMSICASPGYLKERGTPQTTSDLFHHDCLGHLVWRRNDAWRLDESLDAGRPIETRLRSNDGHALRKAAINGAGLILQPEVLLQDDIAAGRLVPVLLPYTPSPQPISLVYLKDHRPRPKLMSLLHYLSKHAP